ncbi:UNVERIFIED_CONTAM: hypothetical protein Scaly_0523400 [Sesamum calycinum]|uniref:Glycosyl transferase CAP10 domain-containing protein n=1 Tax=Sesamum calycinum TaxID=2727403 RepID=A0AAW2RSI2_9LAMI
METMPVARFSMVALFFAAFTLGVFFCTRHLDSFAALMDTNSLQKLPLTAKSDRSPPSKIAQNVENTPTTMIIPVLNCSLGGSCPANSYSTKAFVRDKNVSSTPPAFCPDYFRWIHEDLWPWRKTGITREMVMSANQTANFRLVILDGKAYVQTYSKGFQSRDTFTLWGILQLLRRYPGKVPDLDLMFDCGDLPVIRKENFKAAPPTLFGYCKDDSTFNIVFPDWSFWGWPEINIKPWEALLKDLQAGNKRSRWTEREPNAYWKGNPYVADTRIDLLNCNVSGELDWGARIYAQDWQKEEKEGFKQSDLASQCTHRYKIYIEGVGWSVSEKYILACDSVTLLVKPQYYDFFTRGLMPLQHYWPIKDDDKCRSIKHAVDWGNSHHEETCLPCDEEDLALLAIFIGGEVEIIDSIATLIRREGGCEILVTFVRAAEFVHHHLLTLNLEGYETVVPFSLLVPRTSAYTHRPLPFQMQNSPKPTTRKHGRRNGEERQPAYGVVFSQAPGLSLASQSGGTTGPRSQRGRGRWGLALRLRIEVGVRS